MCILIRRIVVPRVICFYKLNCELSNARLTNKTFLMDYYTSNWISEIKLSAEEIKHFFIQLEKFESKLAETGIKANFKLIVTRNINISLYKSMNIFYSKKKPIFGC